MVVVVVVVVVVVGGLVVIVYGPNSAMTSPKVHGIARKTQTKLKLNLD